MLKDVVLEAKDIEKVYESKAGVRQWVLRGVNIEVMKGDFIAIWGEAGTGKSVLLRVLGFLESPERGEVYFEGRLVGRTGPDELRAMRDERVLLLKGAIKSNKIEVSPGKRVATVLFDEPLELMDTNMSEKMLEQIRVLNRSGIAVIIATREPTIAARAGVIYKLAGGKLVKITGVLQT